MLPDLPWLDFWRFQAAQPLAALLDGRYHISLVVLSVSVAILAAFAAWAVVDRIAVSRSRAMRWLWLWAGPAVLGTGIWAMHFIGMLAFVLATPVTYRLLDHPGVGGPGGARQCRGAPHHEPGIDHLVAAPAGQPGLAVAIGTMHYIGMEALTVDATMHYDAGDVRAVDRRGLSAVDAGAVRAVRGERHGLSLRRRVVGATVMGVAVAGMHYTAMAAAHFHATADHVMQPGAPPTLLAVLICLFVLVILGVTLIGTMVGPQVHHGVAIP